MGKVCKWMHFGAFWSKLELGMKIICLEPWWWTNLKTWRWWFLLEQGFLVEVGKHLWRWNPSQFGNPGWNGFPSWIGKLRCLKFPTWTRFPTWSRKYKPQMASSCSYKEHFQVQEGKGFPRWTRRRIPSQGRRRTRFPNARRTPKYCRTQMRRF